MIRIFRPIALAVLIFVVVGCSRQNSPGPGPTTQKLVSQSFVDSENGWVAAAECPTTASSSVSFACRSVIYRTVDGGRTWSVSARIIMSPKKISFTDQQTGWLVGSIGEKCGPNVCPNVVMLSQDGGKSWNRVSTVSGELVDVVAFSGNDAWALGQVCDAVARCSAELVRTTSAGQIWDNRDLPLAGADFHLERFGVANGWVGGTLSGGVGTEMLGTPDGGATWRALALPCQGGSSRFDFISATAGWLICSPSSSKTTGGAVGQIYQTVDAGRSWTDLGVVSDPSTPSTVRGAAAPDPIGGLRFSSPDRGWLVLADGRLFATDDGGQSWRKELTVAAGGRDVQFVTPTTGWILGQNQIWWTADAGKTWTAAFVSRAAT